MDQDKIRWGILATGAIAKTFARALQSSATGVLHAVASRSAQKSELLAREFGATKSYGDYEALLADADVQAVYIATPHPMHAMWAIRACETGKHVLVEKPFALNFAEAMAMTEAAITGDVLLAEAFMYRCHPQTAKLVHLIRERAIGDVRLIQASFSFHAGFNPQSRIYSNALAGGGIMDVGCYTASMARLIAGAATGQDFADPIDLKATAHFGSTGVDEWTTAALKFPGDILAQLSTGVALNQENIVRIFGSEGSIILPNPWQANREAAEPGRILVQRTGDASAQEISIDVNQTSFTFEADFFGKAVRDGKKELPSPAMTRNDTIGNIRTLDRWRHEIGLVYEMETAKTCPRTTVSGRPLRNPFLPPDAGMAAAKTGAASSTKPSSTKPSSTKPSAAMRYGSVPHLKKRVSRLIMGVDNQDTLPHAAIMFDDFFERGGNTFDTAYVYNPTREKLLGEWINLRGVRDDVVVIVKGAHTPFCEPRYLKSQLAESLENLQIDHADIYLMHRDNPDVPASEFVDCLNEQVRAGRIKTFGGSNWSPARIDEANAHATKTRQQGFSIVSNNLSLARMVDAVWKGCITANDPASLAWHEKTQTPLFAWSSQARGFFLEGRAHPDRTEDAELVRCWYSPDNFQRLERVNELAKKRNVLPINIALAFVLHQSFPTFALIGPRQLSETRTSVRGLEIELSPDEVKWLNLQN